MAVDNRFAAMRASGVTADGVRRFADGSSENLNPDALAALTEANLTESELHDLAEWLETS
ncbi:hypothetical protein DK926_20850 [Rhodococcus sp. Eu-32]|uniref:hypothetical protein n=1 Tax=Rhodococcus sp. Eu-32 TaxID=1017319 RepID=UPI000DF2D4B2|nr:hypothetical protein [Rhodococcus sp. Eu-32]RRQ25844.1 hypothetical protein DK926_20850 [Rhodococcus sp. Eu-32]